MRPEDNFKFLNSYLSRMGPIIRANHGFIDKYLGDGIMALFPGRACPTPCGAAVDDAAGAVHLQRRTASA